MPSFISAEVAKAARGGNTLKARVDAIDEGDDEVSMVRYNAREYVQNMAEMNEELARAWNKEERVKALKMAIQCAKLLGDASTPQFYPSLFVLVTEILDTFGRLVFERIKQKGLTAAGQKKKKVEDFGPSDVTEEARETCKNWFYKVASIRELIPRVYMEMAIIRCYQFLYGYGEFETTLRRIAFMLRGMADPLASTYARAYLVRRAEEINPTLIPPLMDCCQDSGSMLHVLHSPYWTARIAAHKTEVEAYAQLLSPAIDFQLQALGHHGGRAACIDALKLYTSLCKAAPDGGRVAGSAMVLQHVLKNFEAEHLSELVVDLVRMINEEVAASSIEARAHLYGLLGKALVVAPPPEDKRLAVLNEVWKRVTACTDAAVYFSVASVFVQYVVRLFGDKELRLLLGDVARHVTSAIRANEAVQEALRKVALTVIQHRQSFSDLLALQQLMPLVDLLQGKGAVEVSRGMLELFQRSASEQECRDPVAVHTAFGLAKSVHDSVDHASGFEERRDAGVLICSFLRKISFGSELESHLNFLVDCRRFLVNLDDVTQALALEALKIAAIVQEKMKGRHTRRTLSLVKACISYLHVTAPSVQDRVRQLQLLLLGGQVALRAGLISQAESLFKQAITAFSDFKDASSFPADDALHSFLASFASTLVAVPGHPEHGPLYLVNGLLNVVQRHPWQGGEVAKAFAYAPLIALICTYAQPKLPYSVAAVEGNDVLFGKDDAVAEQLNTSLASITKEAVEAAVSAKSQPALALRLLNVFLATAELGTGESTRGVAVAWQLFKTVRESAGGRVGGAERKELEKTVLYCERMGERMTGSRGHVQGGRLYLELAKRMTAALK